MMRIRPQPIFHCLRVDSVPPVAGDEFRLQAQGLPHARPGFTEHAGLEHQDAIAGRQAVAKRRLPGAVAVGGVDKGLRLLGAEYRLQIIETGPGEADDLVGVQLDGRSLHGAQHPLGNIRRARRKQEVSPASNGHTSIP